MNFTRQNFNNFIQFFSSQLPIYTDFKHSKKAISYNTSRPITLSGPFLLTCRRNAPIVFHLTAEVRANQAEYVYTNIMRYSPRPCINRRKLCGNRSHTRVRWDNRVAREPAEIGRSSHKKDRQKAAPRNLSHVCIIIRIGTLLISTRR